MIKLINVKTYKMTTMPLITLAKIVNQEEQYGKAHFKLALKNQNEKKLQNNHKKAPYLLF